MRILAHAFGKRYDLPIPLYLFLIGGALVVIASFVLVAGRPGRAERTDVADVPHRRRWSMFWSPLSFVVLAGLVACGLFGNQDVPENIVPTSFWVIAWIAVPLTVGVLGDWTGPVNPFGWISRGCDSARLRQAVFGSPDPLPWPRWLGWWPAALLYFVVVCGELIFNLTATTPRNTALGLLVYAVFCALCGLLFGRRWFDRGEVFTVLFDTWGRLGFFRFGAPGRRGFAGGLEVPFAPAVSRIAFVLLLLFSVNFDGLLSTPQWADLERNLPGGDVTFHPTTQHLFRVGSFVVLALALTLVFGLFAFGAARAGRHAGGVRTAVAELLPSLLPIAYGYLLAHNLQYVMVNGQLMFPLIGNPPGSASWPIHLPYPFNDSYEPNPRVLPLSYFWYVAVAVIIAVHVIAVVIAHRHLSTSGRDERSAKRSEYPWLVAMVGYTMLSLWLLAQPLTKETSTTSSLPAHPVVQTTTVTTSE
ncbi:MAG: hypothetical protein QOD07_2451 [Frankiaceae bacterium]|jgi:hypothetical protein|nr:hypothetical protein [Frankiaceae bacterium]